MAKQTRHPAPNDSRLFREEHGATPLRILHLSNNFYPTVTGGTEIFIHQLIAAQRHSAQVQDVLWAAHASKPASEQESVCPPLAPQQHWLPPVILGGRLATVGAEAAAIPGFQALLHSFQPDVVHLHSWSERCGLSHARAVKEVGARLVVTVHAPGFTCMQGSLMHHRHSLCDGEIQDHRCTECRLVNGGLPAPIAQLVATQIGWPLSAEQPGTLAHVLTARQLTREFRLAWQELVGLVDAFHALAAWSQQVLLRNGVPAEAVHLIRTAGPQALPPRTRQPMEDGVLRLVYWGRCAEVKGLHLVIDAIRALPSHLPVELSFYGPYWDDTYGRAMQQRIAGDPRFKLMGTLPKDELLVQLQAYDLAVVPSTWLETGPLTVLEAFAAGLSVAGSDLGGIAELLALSNSGILIPTTTKAWSSFIQRVVEGKASVPTVNNGELRSFSDLESELFFACYQ